MKKILYLLFFITLGIISCSKDNDVTEDVPLESNDEYFVHYEFPQYGSNVLYRDIDGEMKSAYDGVHAPKFDKTIGPVKKGFTATLSGKNNLNSYNSTPKMKIQVSKNNGVLVDKAELYFRNINEGTIEYTIDF